MFKRSAVALLAVLPLVACNSQPTVAVKNATVGEVMNEVADAGGVDTFVSPGRWASKVTIEEMTMPGMEKLPPAVAAQMKQRMTQARTNFSCLTPEQAKRPKEDFFAGANMGCRYDHFTMGGGKIDAAMKCDRQGTTQVMQMTGTYSSDSYSMTVATAASGAGPGGDMKMRMHIDAKRVGNCDGTEEKS